MNKTCRLKDCNDGFACLIPFINESALFYKSQPYFVCTVIDSSKTQDTLLCLSTKIQDPIKGLIKKS